jgi:hypothetical protein
LLYDCRDGHFQRMTSDMRRIAFMLIAGSTMLGGCSSILGSDNDDEADELKAERSAWNRANLSSYEFTFNQGCFCPGATNGLVRIRVVNDSIVSATSIPPASAFPAENIQYLRTIDELFDLIQYAIGEDAYKLDVTYDHQRHYPTSIDIDYIKNAVDDEYGARASDLTPITQ